MDKRKSWTPRRVWFVGGPLAGESRDKGGSGRWAEYLTEAGDRMRADLAALAVARGEGGFYRRGAEVRRDGSQGFEYVHTSVRG